MMTTALHITRSNDSVRIDAYAEPTDDGRVHVEVIPSDVREHTARERITDREIVHGVRMDAWYVDDLDTCTEQDLAKLADEALADVTASLA